MSKKLIYILVAIVAVAGLGYVGTTVWQQQNNHKTTEQTAATPTPTMSMADHSSMTPVSYQGEEGKTALALLMEKYPDSEISGEGANAFVTSINGHAADSAKHEFWKFVVNGQDAQVGAGSYTTKSSDTISWEIDTY
jgi:hypothetical protein